MTTSTTGTTAENSYHNDTKCSCRQSKKTFQILHCDAVHSAILSHDSVFVRLFVQNLVKMAKYVGPVEIHQHMQRHHSIFTARCYAKRGIATASRLFVRLKLNYIPNF